ncbi:MAG: TetR/AcrR family transcriptional regulator [Myxococcales bacterium]|nr:TetR/AcrR family transcriptional regulator [Myxococcales bacterium]
MAIEEKPLVRGEPVVAKVLEATVEEIAFSGYAALTLERVAARAGVNRTTIFRRWPTKKDLVLATMKRMTEQVRFDWDYGSLRADLAELIAVATRTVFAPGMVGMHKMMVEAREDQELGELARCIRDEKHDAAFALLTRAEKRGEFRKDLDKELFLESLMGMLFAKIVFRHETITPEFTRQLLDYVMKVATPARGTARRTGRPAGSSRKPSPRRAKTSSAR